MSHGIAPVSEIVVGRGGIWRRKQVALDSSVTVPKMLWWGSKMRSSTFFVVATFAICSPVHAEWLRLAESTIGQVWYVDPLRVKAVSGKTQAWVKIDHSKDRSVSYRHTMNLFSFECATEKYRMLSTAAYDSYGKVVFSRSAPDYGYGVGYESVIPDTMTESVFKLVCSTSESSP